MRKLELIRALLGLELAHAAIVEDRHRVSVVVFESPVDRRLAIDDGYFIAYCLRHPRSFRRRRPRLTMRVAGQQQQQAADARLHAAMALSS